MLPSLSNISENSKSANANETLPSTVMASGLPDVSDRTDPASAIALAVRFAVIGAVDGSPVPTTIRQTLRHHASAGHPGARTTLFWLDESLARQLEEVANHV